MVGKKNKIVTFAVSVMQKTFKIFFILNVLLIFLSNVSGVSVCLEHADHFSKTAVKKNTSEKHDSTISPDDDCQCALHLQMSHSVLPEIGDFTFEINAQNNSVIPQSEVSSYRCLLDFFSSRAPPCFS